MAKGKVTAGGSTALVVRRGRPTKTQGAAKQKAGGRLATVKDLPLDIFFEIALYLTPSDLLRIAWTSKRLRNVFMSKAQCRLWVAARQNVPGLPDPPSGLSEPKYAALLFSSTCWECGKRGMKYNVSLPVRYCAWCWKSKVLNESVILEKYDIKEHDVVLTLLPHSKNYYPYCGKHPGEYLVDEFKEVAGKYHLQGDKSEQQAFMAERHDYVAEMERFAQALKKWEHRRKAAQLATVESRQDGIIDGLLKLGYESHDFPTEWETEKRWKTILNRTQVLTPRVWENVRPRLEKIIADDKVLHDKCILETRRAHREGELRFVYREYLPKAPVEDGPFPTLTEICYVPEVKKLLDQDEAWIPMTEDRLLTALPALRERARLNKAKLAKLMWDHLIAISKPPKTEIKTLVMDVDVDKGDKGGLRRPKKRKVVDPKFLRGVPDGMEFGSEDILELATSLFHCLLCRDFEDKPVPGKSEAVYNYVELAQHIHTAHFHHRGYFRRPRVDDTARDILAMLGLPEDVRYSEVSGRVACKCPGFKHPSTFAKLVSHVLLETVAYDSIQAYRWASACPDRKEKVVHDHDLANGEPFLQFLTDRRRVPEKLKLEASERKVLAALSKSFKGQQVVCSVCHACTNLLKMRNSWWRSQSRKTKLYLPSLALLEPKELVRHMRVKHARHATKKDAMVPPLVLRYPELG